MTTIAKLTIRNLGPLEAVEIEPGKVNVVRGPNAQGKTTLAVNALEALRYGRARGLASKDSVLLTRDGSAKGWEVEAVVKKGELSETVRRTGARCSHNTAQLDALFGDPRVFQALLRVHGFLDMKPDERRALLTDIVATDTSAVVATLKGLKAPEDVVKAAAEGNLRGAARRATDARRAAASELDGARAALDAPVTDPLVKMGDAEVHVSTVPKEKVEKALASAQKGMQAWTAHALELDAHEKRQAAAARARERLKTMGSPSWTDQDRQTLADAQNALNEARTAAATATADANALLDQMRTLGALLALKDGACPTCRQPIAPARKEAEAVYRDLQTRAVTRQGGAKVAAERTAKLEGDVRALHERQQRATDLRSAISSCEHDIKQAETIPAPTPPARSLQEYQDLLARVREVDRARAAWERAVSDRASAQARIDPLIERVRVLEAVEAAVAPDQAVGLSETVAGVNAFLAEHGTYLFGHEADEVKPAVVLDGDLECSVEGRRYALCSTSERDRASVLVAAALAHLSGVGILVLDEAEHLDDLRFKELLRMAKVLTDSGALEQVWVAQVPARPLAEAKPPPAWLTAWWVEGGRVRPLVAALQEAGGDRASA